MTRFDALDGNAEPEPPHRQLRQIEQGIGAGKGDAVVGANGQQQAALACGAYLLLLAGST